MTPFIPLGVETTARVGVTPKEQHNAPHQDTEPGLFHPESRSLTMRAPSLRQHKRHPQLQHSSPV